VLRISDGCHGLLALCVTNCSHLTDASLVALGQGCTELRTLEVAGCSQFTDSGFQALARVGVPVISKCYDMMLDCKTMKFYQIS